MRPREAPGGFPETSLQQLVTLPAADAAATGKLAASLDVWKVLTHANKEHARRLAIVDCFNPTASDPEQCANITTYGQLFDHVLGLAGHLASLGIGRGSRVAVMLRNCAEVRRRAMPACCFVAGDLCFLLCMLRPCQCMWGTGGTRTPSQAELLVTHRVC